MAQNEPQQRRLVIFGLGYSGAAVAEGAAASGWAVFGTRRIPGDHALADVTVLPFDAAGPALASATHLLATAPPGDAGDPVLARYEPALAAAPALRWIGYLSSTGVYGDRAGGWVDEDTPPNPGSAHSRRRRAAEQQWEAFGGRCAIDIFRLAGIYGPGRSVFDSLRAGTARRIVKPGQMFARIHRDDIARAVLAAMRQVRPAGVRILNLADDLPAENAEVVSEAARLLGVSPLPAVPFAEAAREMSATALSFWAENRKVASARTQAALGLNWRYPTYRDGLRAILLDEAADRPA